MDRELVAGSQERNGEGKCFTQLGTVYSNNQVDPDAATTCTYDSDCSDDQACCESGTDRVCTARRNNVPPTACHSDEIGCTEDGWYLSKQCDRENGVCWCATQCGHPQPDTYSDGVLNCVAEIPPCGKELDELSPAEGPTLPGSFRPRCMAGGYFNHTQCLGSSCWCVDQCGNKFQGTEHPVSTVNTNDCTLRRRCGGDPCDSATCELYPQATCRVEERCGECLPVFSIGDQRVSCLQGSSKVEKAGLCPDPSSITVRRGIFACRGDADCHGNKKCCGNGGGMMCTNPITKIHEGQCPRPWLWECHSHLRTDRCEFDSQCPQSKKCCESGCGKACRDTSDHVNEKVTIGYLLTKPGQCLSVTRMNCSTVFECTTDKGCGSNLKCCSNGCGMECAEPITLVKYGQCPSPSYEGSQCTSISPDNMCMHDEDCHGNQKCCNDGCQNICIEPWKYVKPGECPGESEQADNYRDCSVDMDCPDAMKCCQDSTTLQQKCLNPRFQMTLPDAPAAFCYQDRQRYHHGDEWSRGPCSLCRCWAGVIECLGVTCATPPAGCEAVVIPGRCCPDVTCSGMESGFGSCPSLTGRNHSHLEVWSKDDCTQCTCFDGEVMCTTLSCIPITSVNSTRCRSVPQPGSCCPRLVYSEVRFESDNHCFDTKGVMHHTGDRWHEDPCTVCYCQGNRVECHDRSHSCPRLPHPSCRLLDVKGQCCPDMKCSVIEEFDLGCETDDPFCPSTCTSCQCDVDRLKCNLPGRDCAFNQSLCFSIDQADTALHCSDTVCNKDPLNSCNVGGVLYYGGESWSQDVCTSCVCQDGLSVCMSLPMCPDIGVGCQATYTEGQCCPDVTCDTTDDDAASCSEAGGSHAQGDSWYQDPCTICICQRGVVHCSKVQCPTLQPMSGCQLIRIRNACCPLRVCRNGASSVERPVINYALPQATLLPEPQYRNRFHLAWGKCIVAGGASFCTRAVCFHPRESCNEIESDTSVICPSIYCPKGKPGTCPSAPSNSSDQGECVFQCQNDADCEDSLKCCSVGCSSTCIQPHFPQVVPNQRCVDSYGTRRSEGDIWYRDECTQCACQKSVVVCKSKECMQPPPGCKLLDPYEGDCCGTVVCPHTTERSCFHRSHSHSHGSYWYPDDCETCQCEHGMEICTSYQCMVTKEKGCIFQLLPNRCCPEKFCQPIDSCLYRGIARLNGEKWYQSMQQECSCNDGVISCLTVNCPLSANEGEGCINNETGVHAFCQDITCQSEDSSVVRPTCHHEGTPRAVGDVWFSDPCTSCTCNSSQKVVCVTISCPFLALGQGCRAVPEEGLCCPQVVCHGVHSCMSGSMEHLQGEVWQEDDCTFCLCLNGQHSCTKKICPTPKPHCHYTKPKAGQCCRDIVCMPTGAKPCRDSPLSEKFYLHDEVWRYDACTIAQCDNGVTLKIRERCPFVVPPPGCYLVAIQGQCCPHIDCSQGKQGQCPLQGVYPQSSGLDLCAHDADCSGSMKCCHDGTSLTCVNTLTIDHPGQCPPSFVSKLPIGQACILECYSDRDCPTYEKCCMSRGCGMSCKRPIVLTNRRPLSNVTGHLCSILENLVGSHRTGKFKKDGQCPKFSDLRNQQRPLVAECIFDNDCPGMEKCCPTLEFKMCLKPIIEDVQTPGECPAPKFRDGVCLNRQNECKRDGECSLSSKCCYDGCSYQCMLPARENADGPCPYIHGTCDGVCSQGYATNALQCEVCRCSRWCPFLPFNCFFDCPYGYATDRVGCKMCHCKRAIKPANGIGEFLDTPVCLPINPVTCRLSCSLGYVTDSMGCRICRCRTEDQECTPIETCGLYCPLGYATDHLGCQVCKCQQRDGTDEVFLPQKTLCPATQCSDGCMFGSATDQSGCPTCACLIGISAGFSTNCMFLRCPYGFATDGTGKKVCRCRLPALCKSMGNCALECEFGRLSDAQGCEACACKPEYDVNECPVLTTANCPELDMCAYGLASTSPNGCEICVCKTPVTDCPPLSREACQLRCRRGFATDENGCEMCICTKSDDECTTLVSSKTCNKTCLFGLATDSDGCQICSCKIPSVQPLKDPFQIQALMVTPCPPVTAENCALVCPEGYATDHGCEICACQHSDGCPALNVQQCPLLPTCPYGLSTDRHGCQACSCRQPTACLPVSIQNCSIHCPRGRATDSDGCEVCACRNTSSSCPNVNRRNCQKACTYGYATDPITHCQVCLCKQPTEVPIAIASFRICEPVTCTNNCSAGFLHDDQGCPSCNCKDEGIECPELPMSVCPQQMLCPYGLGMDSRGCPVCFCRVESGCYLVSPLTCDLDCQYGYATDEHGCETCRCRIFDVAICDQTISSTCHKKCPYGLATDGNGCEICSCKNEAREISIVTLKPVITCPPVDCEIKCEFGLATDSIGCEVCSCKRPITDDICTALTSSACPLLDQCKFGLATDENGCSVCQCKQSIVCNPLPSCSLSCSRGLATDVNGCDICMCKSTLPVCPAVTLEDCPLLMVCELGLATNASGCEVCRCKPDIHPFLPPKDTFFASSSSRHHAFYPAVKLVAEITNCPPVRCDIDCREMGFATNALGCPICECVQTVSMPFHVCSPLDAQNCKRLYTCPYGLHTDENGCTTCKCKLPGFCHPVKENCDLECNNGLATDQQGCEICSCKSVSVEECPEEVTSATCPLTCPFGLATDNDGCEVCRCKVPASVISANVALTMGLETLSSLSIPLYWIPTVKCPTLAACSLSCDQGYATNADGCTVCRCVADESSCSPSFTSSQCPIMDLCPYGLATSEIGCLICKCRQPTPCPATVPIFCSNPCPHGFASNTFGCPNIASCHCITPANDPLCHPEVIQNCKRHCFHGYATDSNGCEICRCRMPFTLGAFFSIAAPVFNVFWQETNYPHMPYAETSLVPASPCPLVDSITCQEDCPNGLATDMGGCPVCRCKTLAELCPRVDPVICPQVNACPYGLATGPTGCDICICKDEVSCEPVNHLTCSTSCPHSHATDGNGCEICQQCLKHAGDCPPVNDCEKHCLYGYASNDEGCPVCKCKQAASHFPLRSTLHSELFDTYLTTRCSAVSCDLHCHHGYQLDASGCGLCECIPDQSLCPAVSCSTKCHYGFNIDMNGCKICSCRKNVYCQQTTPFNCPLTCNHEFATDVHGCDICKCKIQRSECHDPCLSPMMHCAFGLATDNNGCEICSCKMPIATGLVLAPGIKPRDCVALSTRSCDLSCDHGYRSDQHGCEICQCMNQTDDCPSMATCRLQSKCPYGLASGPDGCPKCACKHPGVCDPLPSYCDLECELGFSTDKFGCELCLCKKAEGCPVLEPCPLTCPLGLATCPCQCEICKCKLPNSYTLSVLSDLTAIPIWNESALLESEISNSLVCPELNCLATCPFGYAIDPISGCLTCQCKTRLRCPSLLEPKVAMETRCQTNADCRDPHQLCCYTGTLFMCMDAVEDSCTDDFGKVHSHGEVWNKDCDIQCSCFHGNIIHTHFQTPSIPEGCQYEIIPGHCYYSYTCVNATCQDTEDAWSVDECTQCSCRDDSVTPVCTRLPCPEVPHGCHVAEVENSCCPDIVCPGCRDAVRHLKVEGQMWNDDLCTSCFCEEGQRSCRRMACEIPRPECQQIFLPDQCCPKVICPGDFKRPCEAIRSMRNPLQLLDESPTHLPGPYIPSCIPESGYFNATQCYPAEGLCWCADHLGREVAGTRTKHGIPDCWDYGCVDLQGNYHHENETWNRDQCTTCQCIQGLLVCIGPRCRKPPRGCDVLEVREDCGCPQYICNGFCFDDRHSIKLLSESWHTGDCINSCECAENGVITCRETVCQEPPLLPEGCFHKKRLPDDCCPSVVVCFDGTDLSECPAGTQYVAICVTDPCLDATCHTYPNAICHSNFCGGCRAIFYDEQNTGPIDCARPADSPQTVRQYGTHNISCHALLELTTANDSAYFPRCTGYNSYSAKQCDSLGSCWCVGPDGVHVADSEMEADSTVLCIEAPCRQELESNQEKVNLGRTVTSNPVCDTQGMYIPQQCTADGTQCWCSEPDGTMIPNTKRASGESVSCLEVCGGRQALTTRSCNSVIPCPLNYYCNFMTPSNHGICCLQS